MQVLLDCLVFANNSKAYIGNPKFMAIPNPKLNPKPRYTVHNHWAQNLLKIVNFWMKKHLDETNFLKYTFSAHCSQESHSQLTSSPLYAQTLASLFTKTFKLLGCNSFNIANNSSNGSSSFRNFHQLHVCHEKISDPLRIVRPQSTVTFGSQTSYFIAWKT